MVTAPSVKTWFASKHLILWDFDGVIKDSVEVKTQAYIKLFSDFGGAVCKQIRIHHAANGGMSRLEKLPLYLSWAGVEVSDAILDSYCEGFHDYAYRGVIESPWVPGVESILRRNPFSQQFVLVTATPEEEIKKILDQLDLSRVFWRVIGAPNSKKDGIAASLDDSRVKPDDALMVGDSSHDLEAAEENNIDFLVRKTQQNSKAFKQYKGKCISDFRTLT
jgi:phosphoglycolate phosphatase-like HAD superfamily hydrolase